MLLIPALACICRGETLASRLNTLIADPQVKGASVGVHVVEITATGPVELFSHNADTPLTPASNAKILTTAAAFERYGPNATLKTRLFKVGDDLILVGAGDPGLGDSKIMQDRGLTLTKAFDDWADQLKAAGITSFRHIAVDDRVFDTQFVHPNWPADQRLDWYEAPVGGLNFNANCLDWMPKLTALGISVEILPATTYVSITNKATKGSSTTVSLTRPDTSNAFELKGTVAASSNTPFSVPIVDPGMWTATILRDRLLAAGLTSTGTVQRVNPKWQPADQPIAVYETPIISIIQRANTNSLNMMAEALCKRLGHDASGQPGSWENGTAAVEAYAKSIKVPDGLVVLDDGSGLSKVDKVAARAFTMALAHVAGRPDGEAFVQTFATPGTDGTLKKRFNEAGTKAVADAIHAKTGHINDVSTLSGYIDVNGRRFAFSILCNGYKKTTANVNPWQDQVCAAIYNWAR